MTITNQPFLLEKTGASHADPIEMVQSLWSGYGNIIRYQLYGCALETVIVKQISPPTQSQHPRGWNTDWSHQRKLKSYQVEAAWYEHWANQCDNQCYVPHCYGVNHEGPCTTIILEDLDAASLSLRKQNLTPPELEPCLSWLAHFHARFMGQEPNNLWAIGSYWHLQTRPDELDAMENGALKNAAATLDKKLNDAKFKTLIHGDAKVANFCFSENGEKVAAVDFQYVGGGCGMKDLAYFMGSCLDEQTCAAVKDFCLEFYFSELRLALAHYNHAVSFKQLEKEWRSLFPVAWADFHRFLMGWMPSHKKINSFSTQITEQALREL